MTDWRVSAAPDGGHRFVCGPDTGDGVREAEGEGSGPLPACVAALSRAGIDVTILDFREHATRGDGDSEAVAYVECRSGGVTAWDVGLDASGQAASVRALLAAVHRVR
ncbi:alpha-isopropylmalate synthase regulatory domain-containing protein [Streptomyces tsukubensis]|uniref:alpha-isopropylmalate synthase regulatory domain-containing protein n=1 Tax=Streptomyces tsukubensis TaxID=83656 RepID=UPI002220BFE5|nr:alpha-isopropylmalate synthase regulatory domain-containing protein [Streptomyces tsukubensis]